jgi:hypothetical protein
MKPFVRVDSGRTNLSLMILAPKLADLHHCTRTVRDVVLNSLRPNLLALQESRSDKASPPVASSKRLGSATGDNRQSLLWREMCDQPVSSHCSLGGVWPVVSRGLEYGRQ